MFTAVLVAGHATFGTLALIAGCLAIRRDRAFTPYLSSLLAGVAFLFTLLAVRWTVLDTPTQWLFAALAVLAGYVIWRALRARRYRRPTTADQSDRYLSHLGFTLIALLVGFVAIAVLDLGAPGWFAAAAGAGCIAAGHFRLEQIKNRARQMRTRTPAPTVGNPR